MIFKRLRYLAVLPILIVLVISIFNLGKPSLSSKYKKFLSESETIGLIDHSADPYLERILSRLEEYSDSWDVWQINKSYQENALNIYVFRTDQDWSRLSNSDMENLSKIIDDNVLAISPNVIIIDHKLLGELLYYSFSDVLNLFQVFSSEKFQEETS